jgi:hypothetical protein
MKGHFSSPEDARSVVEPVLRAWEVATDLQRSRGELRFSFVAADIIDERGIVVGPASAPSGTSARMDPLPVIRTEYPAPPSESFRLNAEAWTILHRYEGYLEQREPLQAMAYFCLTVLEGKGRHKRQRAADKYNIDIAVLDTIGTLTTKHGDDLNARKASAAQPLTAAQQTWLEAAVKKLISSLLLWSPSVPSLRCLISRTCKSCLQNRYSLSTAKQYTIASEGELFYHRERAEGNSHARGTRAASKNEIRKSSRSNHNRNAVTACRVSSQISVPRDHQRTAGRCEARHPP